MPLLDVFIPISCFFLSCSEQAGRVKCPVDPYFIIPDRCVCVDFQTQRLQEAPDAVPHGEMPRHMQLYCDRWMDAPTASCCHVMLFLSAVSNS